MALRSIHLRNFVIVEEVALEFEAGFTALTGETGAGKSILIDALQLLLGDRADASVVREGADRAELSAEFDSTPALAAWLSDNGFDADDAILLRRTIDRQGRSRAWINGTPATTSQLRALGESLIDIHGQHAWQSLTRASAIRALLDAYAGADTAQVADRWQQWQSAQRALASAESAQETLARERERLDWQLSEIERLAPGEDEWSELNASHSRLAHAQALIDAAALAAQSLAPEDDVPGAIDSLARAHHALLEQASIEPEFAAIADILAQALAQAEDALHSLNGYLRKTSVDPERLALLDARLALWLSLARRYKSPPEDLPALRTRWLQERAELEAAADLDALRKAERAAAAAYQEAALELSQQRRAAAPRLAEQVTRRMQSLGMEGGRFEVEIRPLETPASSGIDDVVFLVAGHAGSAPKPVAKVASGGELSRLSLAIAVTTSELGAAPTLIFDEIDAGIGGVVGDAVGRLMQTLGRHRQVLAVTHLPQVAAHAHHHLRVAKRSGADGRTISSVEALNATQRVEEVARMLGSDAGSRTSIAHAQDLLERAARAEVTAP